MRIHWGYAIAIFFTLFVLTGITAIIASKRYELGMVKKNYYDDDIGYQKIFDKKQNNKNLTQPLNIAVDQATKTVLVTFPAQLSGTPVGQVRFMRPSKVASDFEQTISIDTNRQMRISIADKSQGLWKMSVDWEQSGMAYLHEMDLTF